MKSFLKTEEEEDKETRYEIRIILYIYLFFWQWEGIQEEKESRKIPLIEDKRGLHYL